MKHVFQIYKWISVSSWAFTANFSNIECSISFQIHLSLYLILFQFPLSLFSLVFHIPSQKDYFYIDFFLSGVSFPSNIGNIPDHITPTSQSQSAFSFSRWYLLNRVNSTPVEMKEKSSNFRRLPANVNAIFLILALKIHYILQLQNNLVKCFW